MLPLKSTGVEEDNRYCRSKGQVLGRNPRSVTMTTRLGSAKHRSCREATWMHLNMAAKCGCGSQWLGVFMFISAAFISTAIYYSKYCTSAVTGFGFEVVDERVRLLCERCGDVILLTGESIAQTDDTTDL